METLIFIMFEHERDADSLEENRDHQQTMTGLFMSIRSKKISVRSVLALAGIVTVLILAQSIAGLAPAKASAATVNNWYLAEGFTGAGFQEYICLGNPGASPASATVTFLFNGAAARQLPKPPSAQPR